MPAVAAHAGHLTAVLTPFQRLQRIPARLLQPLLPRTAKRTQPYLRTPAEETGPAAQRHLQLQLPPLPLHPRGNHRKILLQRLPAESINHRIEHYLRQRGKGIDQPFLCLLQKFTERHRVGQLSNRPHFLRQIAQNGVRFYSIQSGRLHQRILLLPALQHHKG